LRSCGRSPEEQPVEYQTAIFFYVFVGQNGVNMDQNQGV